MPARVSVHVHATDSISRLGLQSQLRCEPGLYLVERTGIEPDTVVVVAADGMDDATLRELRELNRLGCRYAVLVTDTLNDNALLAAIDAGVCGLVRRCEVSPARLGNAVRKAARGEAALPADLLAKLLKQLTRLQHNVLMPRGLTMTGLSPREAEVLRLVADGLDTNEIACALCYSARTVKNILHGVTTRLCLRNRSHAVAYALREGLI